MNYQLILPVLHRWESLQQWIPFQKDVDIEIEQKHFLIFDLNRKPVL